MSSTCPERAASRQHDLLPLPNINLTGGTRLIRIVAILYTTFISIAAVWAWVTDIHLLHSEREHLLPGVVLYIAAMPLSLSVDALYPLMRQLLDTPFVQLAVITICAATQAALLWLLAAWAARKFRSDATRADQTASPDP